MWEVSPCSHLEARQDEPHYVSEDRDTKISMLVAIPLSPDVIRSLIIIPEKMMSHEIMTAGQFYHVGVVGRKTSFCTTEIMMHWAITILLPYVQEQRMKLLSRGCTNLDCVVLLDGFAGHKSPAFLELLTQYNINPIFLIPFTSHAFHHSILA